MSIPTNHRVTVPERDQELMDLIEGALTSSEASNSDPVYSFCVRLAHTAPSADDNFRQELESRLVAALHRQNRLAKTNARNADAVSATRHLPVRSRWRTALASGLIALLLLAGLGAVYPPARVWAQNSIDELLSYLGFSREAPGPQPIMTVMPVPVQGSTSDMPDNSRTQPDTGYSAEEVQTNFPLFTREQIQAQVGFRVKSPSYLPSGYQEVPGFENVIGGKAVLWRADKSMRSSLCESSTILLSQSIAAKPTDDQERIGGASATAVTVSGAPGLWIERIEAGPCASHSADGKDITATLIVSKLTWAQDGIRYSLSGDPRLGLNEMLKIAESLQ